MTFHIVEFVRLLPQFFSEFSLFSPKALLGLFLLGSVVVFSLIFGGGSE